METIDLRSDTVTRPSLAMREAMLAAPVGDDVYGEDPTVIALERAVAEQFGMEAALFCASGTQTNQIALFLHTGALGEVICHKLSHVYYYEGGGISFNTRASVHLLEGDRGLLDAASIAAAINPDDVHRPISKTVVLENTFNRGGGACYTPSEIERIREVCDQHDLKLHLDGARLYNALIATGDDPKTYGRLFHSLSICLSKGLGAPVGSLIVGSKDFIRQARRVRKVMGGGWRQAGILAAGGLYALQHNVKRLAEDHALAAQLGNTMQALPWVRYLYPVETNIVLFELQEGIAPQSLVNHLKAQGILAGTVGTTGVRLVTHLDVLPAHLPLIQTALQGFTPA